MGLNILNAVKKPIKICDEGGTIEFDVERVYEVKLK
jgi:hypothetical protein